MVRIFQPCDGVCIFSASLSLSLCSYVAVCRHGMMLCVRVLFIFGMVLLLRAPGDVRGGLTDVDKEVGINVVSEGKDSDRI